MSVPTYLRNEELVRFWYAALWGLYEPQFSYEVCSRGISRADPYENPEAEDQYFALRRPSSFADVCQTTRLVESFDGLPSSDKDGAPAADHVYVACRMLLLLNIRLPWENVVWKDTVEIGKQGREYIYASKTVRLPMIVGALRAEIHREGH